MSVQNITSAEDFCKKVPKILFCKQDELICSALKNKCEEFNKNIDAETDEQAKYYYEIVDEELNLEKLEKELDLKAKKLEQERETLLDKHANNELTEEESQRLNEISAEYYGLDGEKKSAAQKSNSKISGIKEEWNSSRQVIDMYKDFGETAIEKGQPLADTKVKGGFFRKVFGSTGKHRKALGEQTVQAGTDLINNLGAADEIKKKIDK